MTRHWREFFVRPFYLAVAIALAGATGCGDGSIETDIGGDTDDVVDAAMEVVEPDVPSDTATDVANDSADPGSFEWPVQTEKVYITPSADWKNEVQFPDDPFLGGTGYVNYVTPVPRWIKFAVLMKDPGHVYFQDSQKYAFHYEFATQRLDPFIGLTAEQFDELSLRQDGQQVILGAVLYAPGGKPAEVGIQLVRMDPYHPEMVRRVFETVVASVKQVTVDKPTAVAITGTPTGGKRASVDDQLKFFYFPTFEQYPSAMRYRDWLAGHGIVVSSVDRWAKGSQCYSQGWAVGRLVEVAGGDIDSAYATGDLAPSDILLTDAVPAEVPFVAGILSSTASTPNSHVALLADSLDIPFAWVALPDDLAHVKSLVGRRVALWTTTDWESDHCVVNVLDASALTDHDVQAIVATKSPGVLDFAAKQRKGAYSAVCDDIGPADIVYFGGKAANYGILRDAIPNNSLYALAFSFDLWDDFMAQPATGGTLGQAIADRLAAHASWPPDMTTLDGDLAAVRSMIQDAPFPADLQAAVKTALAGFDASTKIRFRSSTNVEDSTEFSGAGLYDSYSGCLGDDNDSDESGPSVCDPDEPKERGVFRAIRKVYASFYNRNAFLERLRRQVDESRVGMAILAHYSYPDSLEMANGVAIHRPSEYSTETTLVTQVGAVSVANPENGALPEIVRVYLYSTEPYVEVKQESTLVPIGGRVMEWDSDYTELFTMFKAVEARWAAVTGRELKPLDFEYKKMQPGTLLIKQVRELPQITYDEDVDSYLIGGTADWCSFQGEYGDVYGVHRVKARVTLTARNGFVSDMNVDGWLESVRIEYAVNGSMKLAERSLSMMDDVTWTREGAYVTVAFPTGEGADLVTWRLTVMMPEKLNRANGPFLSMDDIAMWSGLEMNTGTPRPWLDWNGNVTTRDAEVGGMRTCGFGLPIGPDHQLVEQDFTDWHGHDYEVSFWWPPAPTGVTAGYTAPLVQWEDTVITGFTTLPISLTGYWSRSQRPAHHNFGADYAFEPRLDEGIDAGTLAELEAADIAVIWVVNDSSRLCLEHLDGTMTCMPQSGM